MSKKWVKQQKLHELTIDELHDRAAELRAALFANRFQRSSGKLDNYRVLPETRRRLASVLTILREKELAQAKEAQP